MKTKQKYDGQKSTKYRLSCITTLFCILIIVMTASFLYWIRKNEEQVVTTDQILKLNEIEQITNQAIENDDPMAKEELHEKIKEVCMELRNQTKKQSNSLPILINGVVCVLLLITIALYFYLAILKPFERMKEFAEEIASGNLDIDLTYDRANYFGEFTWAFDHMKKEITKARACERAAIENNKTVIATLSHDIKTPIASIRAYAEALEANLDKSLERRERYLKTLVNKCDEVANLTNDLFLHSLADLEKLKMNVEEICINELLETVLQELGSEKNDITYHLPTSNIMVQADKNRFSQVIENLINNSRKYAKTQIDITLEETTDDVFLSFRDYGNGILDEDFPFVFDKFYRGKNSCGEQGAGLGLYIVKYIMEQLDGEISLKNAEKGLNVTLRLAKAKNA